MTREHALHVAVEDRGALAECERGNRRRRRAADAGQPRQRHRIARKRTAMLRDDRARRFVQVMRAAVVTEAAPQREHVVERRAAERRTSGYAGEKRERSTEHRRDLRLLQHDLRKPDAIRIARLLPRKIVATVAALPRDQSGLRTDDNAISTRPMTNPSTNPEPLLRLARRLRLRVLGHQFLERAARRAVVAPARTARSRWRAARRAPSDCRADISWRCVATAAL